MEAARSSGLRRLFHKSFTIKAALSGDFFPSSIIPTPKTNSVGSLAHDPDARITKMKDGRTHLAHKAEHAVDMETGAIVAVTLHGGRSRRHRDDSGDGSRSRRAHQLGSGG